MNREHVPFFVSRLVEGRPVRWVPPERLVGDYDGRERTLQVFNADPTDQSRLRRMIAAHRAELQSAAGGPLVIIFHSRKQSAERHGEFIRAFPTPVAPHATVPPVEECVDEADESGPHRRVA